MEDWRYENLRADVKSLREELRRVEGRTNKVENWQFLLPLRVMMGISWLTGCWCVGVCPSALSIATSAPVFTLTRR